MPEVEAKPKRLACVVRSGANYRGGFMGQFRLALYFRMRQIGFSIWWQKGYSIEIILPFVLIYIGLLKDAKGFYNSLSDK